MLGHKYSIGILLATALLMASPADARLKTPQTVYPGSAFNGQSEAQEDSRFSPGFTGLYQQLHILLGNKLYGYLLQNDEFIVFQDLVITHIEERYPVYSSK